LHRSIGATIYRIAAIVCARNFIVAIQRCIGQAIVGRITGLDAVADVVVVTFRIVRGVHTGICGRVTGVVGTVDTIIAVWWCTWQALPGVHVAGFHTVAEHSIIADVVSA
jgi:hypothetical protein